MHTLYYIIGILFLMWEVYHIFYPRTEIKISVFTFFFLLLYAIWTYIGLFSSQWILHLSITAIGLLSYLSHKVTGKRLKAIEVLDSILCTLVLWVMTFNYFNPGVLCLTF